MADQTASSATQYVVERAQKGDVKAFEILYQEHIGRVLGLCWKLTGGDDSLARELAQDSFVRAWEKLPSFRGDSALGTWLYRLVVNLVLTDKRSKKRRMKLEQVVDMNELQIAGQSGDVNARIDLQSAIVKLPERARMVLVLHDIEGWKHKEISASLSMAVGTSKAQLHRARQLLKEVLVR